ncbi:MAG: efflux RND transporter periplasmic adaptor subunit [Bacteroidota bacterium]|nr:efflux RND transporter periplasmic adaptor subunit [Bacteroidota bacterium]
MNTLYKHLIGITLVSGLVFLYSCSSNEAAPADKKSELDALKKQQAELSEKIKTLEAAIALTDTSSASKNKVTMVKVDTLQKTTFNHYVEIQGKVDTDNNIIVSPEVGGNIMKVLVKRGDKVSKGKVLAEVDATLIRKGIEEVQTSYELVKTLFEKQEKLYKENVGTEVQYLQAKSQKESLESRIASLKEQLKKTKIVAPIDGYVDEVFKKEGEMAAPGFPAFRVIDLSEFKVTGEMAESYIEKVNEGDDVQITFPDIDKVVNAKISVVGKSINEISRTFPVEIRLSAGTVSSIKPNMISYLRIKDYTKTKAIVVPINTVQKSATGNYVLLYNNGKAERKVIKVDYTYGTQALVTEGLNEGDKIITFGYSGLVEGQAIKY